MADNSPEKISFLEEYVLSDNRLDTTSKAFNEDTEEYWQYSLLYILNRSDGTKDAQTQAFLKKLEKSKFKDKPIIKNLLFRQKLKSFDNATRNDLIKDIRDIVNVRNNVDLKSNDPDDDQKTKSKSKSTKNTANKNISFGTGTKQSKKGGIEVDTKAAIALFLRQANQQFRNLGDLFSPNAVDAIIPTKADLDKLNKNEVAGLLTLLKDSPPTAKLLLDLIMKDLKENEIAFGKREIHRKLTVDQMKKLGDMDGSLYKNLSFVLVMAGKLRPISDVNWQNNESYCKAYLDKLRAFANGPLKHVTFKALILYNYLTFYEGIAAKDGNSDVAAYQAAVYGNDAIKKKNSSKLKFPTYDKDTLAAYLKLPRRGAVFVDKQASDKQAKSSASSVDTSFSSDLFPELTPIGQDKAFVERALGYFFLKGEKTADWPMVKKDWALVVFAKEKLMASSGNDKFLKKQEEAIKSQISSKHFSQFNKRSVLRLFETNKKYYKVSESVTIEYFTKNNPEIIFNVYQLNQKNYYSKNLSEIPVDISLDGATPMITKTKKYKDKSIIRRADSITIKSLKGKRGIFVIDIIGKNISTRAFLRKGELRFIYEQTNTGYDFYVFDENYNQIMKPRIIMDGVSYTPVVKDGKDDAKDDDNKLDKAGKITLPYSGDADRDDSEGQLIIIEDSKSNSSAVLREFRRQYKKYELRGGFYIDRENLLSKEQAKLLIRSNLYLCQEQTSLDITSSSYVTLEFKTLDGKIKKDVRRVTLNNDNDIEIEFTVPSSLREISCKLNTTVNGSIKLDISHSFKVNGIDACPFIADVFILPSPKKGYYLLTVGKNGEIFANEVLDIKLYHRYFSRPVECMVTTDNNGLFELGKLENVTSITVHPRNTSFFSEKSFNLLQNLVNVPSRINRKDNTKIRIPFSSGTSPKIYIYDAQFSSDISKAAKYNNGYIEIEKLPPGDYTVYIQDILNATVKLHISGGKLFKCHLGEYVLSNSRILQLSEDTPLQITNVKSGGDGGDMEIQLDGSNKQTRVHVIITSLLPVFTPYQSLCAPIKYPDVIDFVASIKSQYTKTSKCNEEFMYILNRNKSKTVKYNGNNLYSPSLIMGKYAAPQDRPSVDTQPAASVQTKTRAIFRNRYDGILEESFAANLLKSDDTSNVEFLNQPSIVFSNLKADANGIVKVPAFKKGDFRVVQIIATDDDNTALLNYSLNNGSPIGPNMPSSDVRLNNPYNPSEHYSPCRKILCLNKGEKYDINDFTSSEYMPFEKLSSIFDLFCGLSGEKDVNLFNNLSRFRPLVEWNTLTNQQKLDFYDKNMCNEVNFFLYKRDKTFFNDTVSPTISNKIRKEFLDNYLLDNDLSHYLDNYIFSTLNTFEQILLCSKYLKDTVCSTTIKTIEENAALLPRNPKDDDRVFAAAKYRNRVDLLLNNFIRDDCDDIKQQQQRDDDNDNGLDEKDPDNPMDEGGDDDNQDDDDDNTFDPFRFDETFMVEESNYYNVSGIQSTTDLIKSTKFWKDYAVYLLHQGGKGTFLSPFIGHATSNINEMLLALCVIDLPLSASEPVIARPRGAGINSVAATLTASDGACIVFLEELVQSSLVSSTLSVHSNYFDPRDSSEIVHGEKVDKFVVGMFETRKIYGCRSVITNVSSVEQSIEVLLQIPEGSIAVNQSYKTKSYKLRLSPFMTERLTYYFYFPLPSASNNKFKCFPVHINKNGRTIAYALDSRLTSMTVVGFGDDAIKNAQSVKNRESWDFITDPVSGNSKDILNFLRKNPRAYEVDLSKLSDRLSSDPKFFDQLTAILKDRGIYDELVWEYSLISDKGGAELCEYLSQQKEFLEYIHPFFVSNHFNYSPFDRFDWSLTEFIPLISSRTHNDGIIQNLSKKFIDKYGTFLLLIAFRSFSSNSISIVDKLIFIQYLIYQNRINEAKQLFRTIIEKDAKGISSLIYDYISCYLSVYNGNASTVQASLMKCMSWKAKPLPISLKSLWNGLELLAKEVDKPDIVNQIFDNDFILNEYNNKTSFIDFNIIPKKDPQKIIDISYRNLTSCTINYYSVDLELLFSQSPFNSNDNSEISKLISLIYPNNSNKIKLTAKPDDNDTNLHQCIDLPKEYVSKNTIIELVGDNNKLKCAKSLNDNSFIIQFDRDNVLGECRIVYGNKKDKDNYKKPIAGAYIKVYSKNKFNNKSKFYKDGYTDIRGRFNYKKLSTNQLSNSSALSMFVSTPNNGSTVIDVKL